MSSILALVRSAGVCNTSGVVIARRTHSSASSTPPPFKLSWDSRTYWEAFPVRRAYAEKNILASEEVQKRIREGATSGHIG